MKNNINKAHKNVVGYMDGDKYVIVFKEYIFDSWRDGDEMDKMILKILNPGKHSGLSGWEDMHGSFIKDNIRVDTWWTNMLDYYWEISTSDEKVQNKVYEWAVTVYDEYRRSDKSDNEDRE